LESILDTPVAQLVDRPKLDAALDLALCVGVSGTWTIPLARRLAELVMVRLRARPESMEHFVPQSAREKLDELVGLPEVIPETLVNELSKDPAVEALIQDVLFEALKQFSHKVNPFVAEWGLPALLRHLPPFGFGALKSAFEARKAEFEERMEPEIRKFVQGFSRKSVERLRDLALRKQKEPELVALRKRLLGVVLARPLRDFVWSPEEPQTKLALDAAAEITRHVAAAPLVREQIEELVEAGLRSHGDKTLRAVLEELGVKPPDPKAMAEAYLPLGRAALRSSLLCEAVEEAIAEVLTARAL
jgi:hypothetical protein